MGKSKWVIAAVMMIAAVASALTPYNQNYERKIVNGFEVIKGERPAIDLNKVPAEAYEPGKLTVKFKEGYTLSTEERYIKPSTKGFAEVGIASVDQVNKSVGAQQFDRKFYSLLEIPAGTIHSVEQHRSRHEAWGFHRVYEIEIPLNQDVIAAVKQYAALPEVEYAEPVYKKALHEPTEVGPAVYDNNTPIQGELPSKGSKWTPNDTYLSPNQWHYYNYGQTIGTSAGVAGCDSRALAAWDIEKGNPNFVTAIIDQGIDFDHPDIAANMWSGRGWNFTNNSSTINPGDHGSHVAGVVSGVTNNGIGIAGLAGGDGTANTGSKVMSCQVFDSSNGGFDLAMIWSADQGASISQNSWGYTSTGVYEQSVLDAIDYFNANGGGTGLIGGITIFASGNDNLLDQARYPGYYSGAMAVAGHDNKGDRYTSSNTGDYIEITAPAVNVYSCNRTGGYMLMTGTSMACPHVSGAAAMIVANTEGILTAPDLRFILSEAVWDIYATETSPTYAGKLGKGALDASAALTMAQEYKGGVPMPGSFTATTASQSQINLAWTKNEHNDNVLIAWAPDGQAIGTPVNGTVYSVGQAVPGGGTVLYYSNGTSYSHTALTSGTGYDYKIWSRAMAERQDSQGEWYQVGTYSNSRTAGATTQYGTFYLPFTENFNASTSLPGGWTIVDIQGGGQVWQFGTHASGLSTTGGSSGNYAFLNSDAYGSGKTQNTDLVTPLIDMTGYSSITLSFTHYYRHYTGTSATLSYSINGGSSWTVIQTWTASNTNPTAFNQVIAALANQANVKLKWNFTGTYGYYWDFDNVSITGTTAVPATPTLLTPANGTNTTNRRPAFDWTDSSGATSYTIQVDNNSNFSSPEIQQSPTVSNYTPTADLALGTYYWRVLATNTNGSSAYTSAWTVNIGSVPAVPTLATPTNGSTTTDTTPTFDWNDVSGATAYTIQVDNNSDFSSPEIQQSPTVSTYTPGTALAAGTYYWRVLATNAYGSSAYSSSWSVIIGTVPATPTLLSPANGTNTTNRRPAFDWSDSSGATSYTIQVDNNSDFSSPEISQSPTVSNYTPTADLALGTYYWRVLATNTYGSSVYTSSWSLNIGSAPAVPTLATPTNGSTTTDTTPTFDWNDVSGATAYTIQVDNNSDFSSPEIQQSPTVSEYTPGTAMADGTYYWRVLATNAYGSSAYSSSWSLIVQAPAPNIALSTAQINTTAAPEATDTDSFNINNTGTADLNYTLSQAYVSKGAKADITVHSNDFTTFPGTGYTNSNWVSNAGAARVTAPGSTITGVLTSPAFDGTVCSALYLDFTQNFSFRNGSYCRVEYFNGSSWAEIYYEGAANNITAQHIEIPVLSANMQLRFTGYMTKAGQNAYWEIDNIVVSGPEAGPSYSWLTINSSTTGTVAASGSNTINLTCNAAGLVEGTYNANITVASNDPDEPSKVLPVQFVVLQTTIIPGVPSNVVTSVVGTDIQLDWDVAADATSYDVYASDDPYGTFTFVTNVSTNQYVAPYTDAKKFWYIISKNATK
jgi:subtilisin family serine protease